MVESISTCPILSALRPCGIFRASLSGLHSPEVQKAGSLLRSVPHRMPTVTARLNTPPTLRSTDTFGLESLPLGTITFT